MGNCCPCFAGDTHQYEPIPSDQVQSQGSAQLKPTDVANTHCSEHASSGTSIPQRFSPKKGQSNNVASSICESPMLQSPTTKTPPISEPVSKAISKEHVTMTTPIKEQSSQGRFHSTNSSAFTVKTPSPPSTSSPEESSSDGTDKKNGAPGLSDTTTVSSTKTPSAQESSAAPAPLLDLTSSSSNSATSSIAVVSEDVKPKGPVILCTECNQSLPKSSFSMNQQSKSKGKKPPSAKCKSCVAKLP